MGELILLGDPSAATARPFARLHARSVRSCEEAWAALRAPCRGAVWIAPGASAVGLLVGLSGRPSGGDQRLLVVKGAEGARHEFFHALFRYVVAGNGHVALLPVEEMAEVLASDDRENLFIGVAADAKDRTVILYRGTIEPLLVPAAWFRGRPGGPKADLSKLAVTDFGQTIRLGEFEAASDALLYEFDAEYRRRARKRSLAEDASFGGALRRLRLQKGLGRGDFPGVTEKEVARIERGEVKTPNAHTLAVLAQRLGVAPDEIATF